MDPAHKAKSVLNRRPAGYWRVFSNWWRERYAAANSRPTVNEVIDWYHQNADAEWPAGQVPSLKAVLRQSKGLRPIDGLKEYFREYRKKRKQQGGQPLTAGSETAQRRSRVAKRRQSRSAHADSTDDELDAMDHDAEGSQGHSDEFEEAEAPVRTRHHRGAPDVAAGLPDATVESISCARPEPSEIAPSPELPSSTTTCVLPTSSGGSHPASPSPDAGPSAVDETQNDQTAAAAFFAAWHPAGLEAVAAAAALAAPPPLAPVHWAAGRAADAPVVRAAWMPLLPCAQLARTDSSATDPTFAAMTSSPDPVAPQTGVASLPPTVAQYHLVCAVPIRRAPRTIAALCRYDAASLPPLFASHSAAGGTGLMASGLCRAAAALLAPDPVADTNFIKQEPLSEGHAEGDACSTGGSVPPCIQGRLRGELYLPRTFPHNLAICPPLHCQYPSRPLGADCDSAVAYDNSASCWRRSSSATQWPPVPAAGAFLNQHTCPPPQAQDHCQPYYAGLHYIAPGCGDASVLSVLGLPIPQMFGEHFRAEEGGACSSSLSDCQPLVSSKSSQDLQGMGQSSPSCAALYCQQQKERPAAPAVKEEQHLLCSWRDRPLGMTTAGSVSSMANALSDVDVNGFLSTAATVEGKGYTHPATCAVALGYEGEHLCYQTISGKDCAMMGNDCCSGATGRDAFDHDLAVAWECFVACSSDQDTAFVD